MKIEFTNEQFEELIKLNAIATGILGILGDSLPDTDYKKRSIKANEIEKYLLKHVKKFDCEKYINPYKNKYVLDDEIFEKKILPIITDYEELGIVDGIASELAWRDFRNDHTPAELNKLKNKNSGYFGVELFDYEEKYQKEFEKNGFERLYIKGDGTAIHSAPNQVKMSTKDTKSKNDAILQFKISLNNSSPKIWRRILVPKSYSFFELHCAIQDAMGWTDSHLHAFYINQKGTTQPLVIQFPDAENEKYYSDRESLDEKEEKIEKYFVHQIKQCQYSYDFGDGWDHTIIFEKELSKDNNLDYPACLKGENACPPDDCGGLGGYDRLLKILKNPKNPEYREMCEWMGVESGDEFDPLEFEPSKVEFIDPKERLKEWEEGYNSFS